MIKKGYTLIEVIIVLAILVIIISTFGLSYNFFNKSKEELYKSTLEYEVSDALSYAKLYCFNKQKSGKLLISNEDGSLNIKLIENRNLVFSKEFSINADLLDEERNITDKRMIGINYRGVIESTSIIIMINKEELVVTIATGSDDINIIENNYE